MTQSSNKFRLGIKLAFLIGFFRVTQLLKVGIPTLLENSFPDSKSVRECFGYDSASILREI